MDKERSIISAHLYEGGHKDSRDARNELGCYASAGLYRKSDDWGVHLACSMVVRSLDLGRNAAHI